MFDPEFWIETESPASRRETGQFWAAILIALVVFCALLISVGYWWGSS